MAEAIGDQPLPEDPTERRTLQGARHLLGALADAPVIVFVCVENIYPPQAPNERWMFSAAYASQNLCVAARSLGLGTVFSAFHSRVEPEVREILGLPEGVVLATTIPIGWPDRPFGPLTRKPMADVVRHERW
jgi:nitroreductase